MFHSFSLSFSFDFVVVFDLDSRFSIRLDLRWILINLR